MLKSSCIIAGINGCGVLSTVKPAPNQQLGISLYPQGVSYDYHLSVLSGHIDFHSATLDDDFPASLLYKKRIHRHSMHPDVQTVEVRAYVLVMYPV